MPALSQEAGALLAWYRRGHRDLPWRRDRDPYRVWVSEVMLQQTRVEAAIPYYQRFMADFPTLPALARAPLERVLARWSGLGYYDRARSLHAAVRECRERYQGRVPDDPERFGALKGVGPYTLAAVLSIAYDRPLAVVDGNVVRVIARLRALDGHARSCGLRRRVEAEVAALIPDSAPGDFNQAVMELGATVCTPRAPRCPVCPLRKKCRALALGQAERFPAPAPRAAPREVRWHAALIERRGRILLVRRGDEGRWKGMWELPWSEQGLAEVGARHRLELLPGPEIARLRHSVLNERVQLVLHRASLCGRTPRVGFRWIEPGQLGEVGIASLWEKAIRARTGANRSPGDGGSSR